MTIRLCVQFAECEIGSCPLGSVFLLAPTTVPQALGAAPCWACQLPALPCDASSGPAPARGTLVGAPGRWEGRPRARVSFPRDFRRKLVLNTRAAPSLLAAVESELVGCSHIPSLSPASYTPGRACWLTVGKDGAPGRLPSVARAALGRHVSPGGAACTTFLGASHFRAFSLQELRKFTVESSEFRH